MVPVLDDVENIFIKLKIKKMFCRIVPTIKSLPYINVLQNIWIYYKSYQFYAVVGYADKDPHSIDKLSNLAESRRYLRNALPPYTHARVVCVGYTMQSSIFDYFHIKPNCSRVGYTRCIIILLITDDAVFRHNYSL